MTTLKVIEEHFFAISLYDHQAEGGGGGRVSFDAHLFCDQIYLSILTPMHYYALKTLSRGARSTMDSVHASHTAAPGSNPGIPKVFPTIFSMSTVARLIDSIALFQKGIELTN